MADVFISYSRRDGEFVQRLNNAFVGANRVVWIDWQSIARGEDWWREIQLGVESADAFICVVSEHWLTSEICHNELLHARQNHKRVLPVIRQQIRDDIEKRIKGSWMDTGWEQTARDNWDYVRHLNWIFFDEDAKFDGEFTALLTALEEDQPHIKAHTRYQTDALEWARSSSRNPSFLMSGDNLAFAEAWLAQSAGKDPQPTVIQREYIAESRRVEDELKRQAAERERRVRQFRLASGVLAVIGALAIIATFVAVGQASKAFTQVAEALQTLTQVAPVQTAVAITLAAGNTVVANAEFQVMIAAQTLTPIPPTLTAVAQEIQVGENRIESQRLAAAANGILQDNEGNVETAALLGIRALNTAYSLQADALLTEALDRLYTRQIFTFTQNLNDTAMSPDGRFMLSSSDGPARLWNIETGEELYQFGNGVLSTRFSPDGQYVLTGSHDNSVQLWDVQTGEEVRSFVGHSYPVWSVAFSADGRFVATGSCDEREGSFDCVRGSARLWDVETGEQVQQFIGHNNELNRVALSPDNRFLLTGSCEEENQNSACIRGSARLWNARTGEELHQLTGHTDKVTSVAFSHDGQYALTGSWDETARLWDVQTGEEVRQFVGNGGGVTTVAFSSDDHYVLTGGIDYMVRLWDTQMGEELRQFTGHTSYVGSLALSADDRYLLTGGGDYTVRLWDLQMYQRHFTEHTSWVTSASFSPDGRYALTGSDDNTAWLWDVETGEGVRQFVGHTDWVKSVAFSPDGHMVLTGSLDGTARLWDAQTGEELGQFDAQTFEIASVGFSPDGRTIFATGYIRLWLWNVQTGEEIHQLTGALGLMSGAAFSPDGRTIVGSGISDRDAHLWDVQTGEEIRQFTGHTGTLHSVTFSRDGRYVATASDDQTARLWDAQTGEELRQFVGHTDVVWSVAFSPDSRYLVTTSNDHTVRLWDVETGEEVRQFRGQREQVLDAVFSPDGRYILTGSIDGTARLYHTDYHDFIAYACTRVFRDFTEEERADYDIIDDAPTCPQFNGE